MPIASAPIAVCSWSLRASNSAMLVERVQATGAKAVQLALTPIADWDAAWGDTFARLADAGIEVVSGMLETVGEDYSTLDTIRATGGVVPDATWPAMATGWFWGPRRQAGPRCTACRRRSTSMISSSGPPMTGSRATL